MNTITAKEFLVNTFPAVKDFMSDEEISTIAKGMELYAKGKCMEQRQLCHDEILDEPNKDWQLVVDSVRTLVLDAPEPQFEL